MSVKIRLSRGGAKKRPYYRIVVADSRYGRDGRFIEKIGAYNPMLPKDNPDRVKIDLERAAEWIKKGAKPTDRVGRYLAEAGVYEWTHGNNPKKGEPGEKAKQREEERREKEEARKQAEEEAKAAAAAAEAEPAEAPAEEEAAAEDPAAEADAPAEEAPAEEEKAG